MFDSIEDLASKLAATGYFIDPVMTQVVFLAAKLQKPLMLEGPAGSGKTQLAVSVAVAAKTHVERLQCYRGVTEDKAIGRFDEGLQRLYMEFSKGQHENWQTVQANLKGRDFFRPGPLMRALECERPCVLLIDELDKVDDGFEAMLLEILSAWQLSIPEFGTVAAKSIPFVVLTSNEERRLGRPNSRRSLYVRVEHPTPEREAEIIASRTPKADRELPPRDGRDRALVPQLLARKTAICLRNDRFRQRSAVARNRPRHRGVCAMFFCPSLPRPKKTVGISCSAKDSRACSTTAHDSRKVLRFKEGQVHEAMAAPAFVRVSPVLLWAGRSGARGGLRSPICGALSRASRINRRVDRHRIAMESAGSFEIKGRWG